MMTARSASSPPRGFGSGGLSIKVKCAYSKASLLTTPPSMLRKEKPRFVSSPQGEGQLGRRRSCRCHSVIGQERLSYSVRTVAIVRGARPTGNAADATAALVKSSQSCEGPLGPNKPPTLSVRVPSLSANGDDAFHEPRSLME